MIEAPITLMLAGVLAFQSPSPARTPPLIEYAPPSVAVVTGTYECAGKPVSFKIKAKAGAVTVEAYSGSAGPAQAAQLEQWNRALGRFSTLTSVEFLCQQGNNELITVMGIPRDQTQKTVKQSVYWSSGYFGVLP